MSYGSKKKMVIVTGGAGYVGAHACKALKREGYNVVVFDNFGCGHRDFIKWGEYLEGDLLDVNSIDSVFKKYRPDAVMHFAAYAYVGESVEDPSKYYRNNVVGTLNLLDAMKAKGVKYFIFSSTCAVYGVPEVIPLKEDHHLMPINPYGATKAVIERMLNDFDVAYGIKSVSLRYFNAAAADPDCEIGEDHTPETHLIPLVLDAASGRRPHITIFGTDYETPDSTCIRDYVHVADLADVHVKALEYLLSGGKTDVFNIGSGKGYSVREVIEAAKHITGKQIPVMEGARRPGDPPALVSSSEKAEKVFSWKPRYNNIEVIIKHAWQWYLKRFQHGEDL